MTGMKRSWTARRARIGTRSGAAPEDVEHDRDGNGDAEQREQDPTFAAARPPARARRHGERWWRGRIARRERLARRLVDRVARGAPRTRLAAEERRLAAHGMADDATRAVHAARRERLDRALEAVEHATLAVARDD